jgi:hypothetical protein
MLLQVQAYYLNAGVINTSLCIKHLGTASILQISPLTLKRNIRIAANPNGLVRFNRHSELHTYYYEKIKPTFSGDTSADYAPEIDITTNYIIEIPKHLLESVFRININF